MSKKQWIVMLGLVALGTLLALTAASMPPLASAQCPYLVLQDTQQRVHSLSVTTSGGGPTSMVKTLQKSPAKSAVIDLEIGENIPDRLFTWLDSTLAGKGKAQKIGASYKSGSSKVADGTFQNAKIVEFSTPALRASDNRSAFASVKLQTGTPSIKVKPGVLPADPVPHVGFRSNRYRISIGGSEFQHVSEISTITWTPSGVSDVTLIGPNQQATLQTLSDWTKQATLGGPGSVKKDVVVEFLDDRYKPVLKAELRGTFPESWNWNEAGELAGQSNLVEWSLRLSVESMNLSR